MHINEEEQILSRLGILTSTLESPRKKLAMKQEIAASTDVTSVDEVPLSSCSADGESEEEVLFDKNSLLNPRKSRRRRRSSFNRIRTGTTTEALWWKLCCLCCSFAIMGISVAICGLSLSEITNKLGKNDVFDAVPVFVFNGIGFILGNAFVAILFTRINAFVVLLSLAGFAVCLTFLVAFQTSFFSLELILFLQGIALGAIERGGFIMVYGLWKGNARVLFTLYVFLSMGSAFCALFFLSGNPPSSSPVSHVVHKRAISGFDSVNFLTTTTVLPNTTAIKPTRPSGAVGIDQNTDTKTAENAEKRKEAEDKQKGVEEVKTEAVVSDSNCTETGENGTEICNSVLKSTTVLLTSTPTAPSSTTTSSSTSTTPIATDSTKIWTSTAVLPTERSSNHLPYNRGRNRLKKPEAEKKPKPVTASPTKSLTTMGSHKLHSGEVTGVSVGRSPSVPFIIAFLVSLLLIAPILCGFCFCCLRTALIADLRIAQLKLDEALAAREPLSCRLLSEYVWILHGAIQGIILSFWPSSVADYFADKDGNANHMACIVVALYWLAAALSYLVIVMKPSLLNSTWQIHVAYGLSVFSCILFHHIFAASATSLIVGVCLLALFSTALPQAIAIWSADVVGTAPYTLSRRMSVSQSFGRVVGPVLTAFLLKSSGQTGDVLKPVLFALVLAYVGFVAFSMAAKSWSRKRQIHQLTSDITGRTNVRFTQQANARKKRKGQYKALLEEEGVDSEVDLEMDFVLPEDSASTEDDL